MIPSLVLLLASALDYLMGDPRDWLHPVQVMGWVIDKVSRKIIARKYPAWQQRIGGMILAIVIIVGSGGLSWGAIAWGRSIHPLLGISLEIILLASCFATRSLANAAKEVILPLAEDNLELARERLSQYVGRDTKFLDKSEILRAVIETVAENTTDGVTAPLFYALLGSIIPGVGIVPLAMAYKGASTLDSMIGYRREPYIHLGWFAAKLEDHLTWLPCRLTVWTLALISKQPQRVWAICKRDAPQDPSPNSGWSESVYAAILGIQLGGVNSYQGVKITKPCLGDGKPPSQIETVTESVKLMYCCFWLWIGLYLIFSLIML